MSPPSTVLSPNRPVGASTMGPAMADLRAYPRYLYDRVAGSLGRRVIEIGVGYGTYTTWLRGSGRSVLATDIDEHCLFEVANRFAGDREVKTARLDLTDEASIRSCAAFAADSIVCFNVLEHIEDDVAALRWLREAVVPGARIGLVVPAHPRLFGRMDAEAGHFRRYTRLSVAESLHRGGWQVERVRYLNIVGAAGWWYHNCWRKNAGLTDELANQQIRAADYWLAGLSRLTDPLFGRLAGLSVMAIAHS